jgi:hypothetical protein
MAPIHVDPQHLSLATECRGSIKNSPDGEPVVVCSAHELYVTGLPLSR